MAKPTYLDISLALQTLGDACAPVAVWRIPLAVPSRSATWLTIGRSVRGILALVWSAGGRALAASCDNGRLQVWCVHAVLSHRCLPRALPARFVFVLDCSLPTALGLRHRTREEHAHELPAPAHVDAPHWPGVVPVGSIWIPQRHKPRDAPASMRDVIKSFESNMLNCVRFGFVAGRERAVVATQSGSVYIFAVPEPPRSGAATPADVRRLRMPAASLEPRGHEGRGRQQSTAAALADHCPLVPLTGSEIPCSGSSQGRACLLPRLRSPDDAPRLGSAGAAVADVLSSELPQHACIASATVVLDAALRAHMRLFQIDPAAVATDAVALGELDAPPPSDVVGKTVAIGAFHVPVNGAQPSPDGAWIAVTFDSMHVVLLPEALDYHPLAGAALSWDARADRCVAWNASPGMHGLARSCGHVRRPTSDVANAALARPHVFPPYLAGRRPLIAVGHRRMFRTSRCATQWSCAQGAKHRAGKRWQPVRCLVPRQSLRRSLERQPPCRGRLENRRPGGRLGR